MLDITKDEEEKKIPLLKFTNVWNKYQTNLSAEDTPGAIKIVEGNCQEVYDQFIEHPVLENGP